LSRDSQQNSWLARMELRNNVGKQRTKEVSGVRSGPLLARTCHNQ
jgi:hypothetical protein